MRPALLLAALASAGCSDPVPLDAARQFEAASERFDAAQTPEEFLDAATLYGAVLDRGVVSGVVEAPLGAHPTCCVPEYGIDVDHLKTYSAAAKGEDAWADYRGKFVDVDDDAYVEAAGGAERIRAIAAPVY